MDLKTLVVRGAVIGGLVYVAKMYWAESTRPENKTDILMQPLDEHKLRTDTANRESTDGLSPVVPENPPAWYEVASELADKTEVDYSDPHNDPLDSVHSGNGLYVNEYRSPVIYNLVPQFSTEHSLIKNTRMPDELLFIHSEAGTPTFAVNLDYEVLAHNITLVEYAINGVPVTGVIPNDAFYNVEFTGIQMTMPHVRSDLIGSGKIPIRLITAYTTTGQDSASVYQFQPNPPKMLKKFGISVTTPLGAPATFTSIALWFLVS